jgi:hypothetical protein
MQRKALSVVLSLALSSAVLTHGASAFAQDAADTSADCVAAYEAAQTERQLGHFKAASHQAMLCSRASCNQTIVPECISLFEAIKSETPTMVLAARRADGGDLVNVRVEMDGQPLVDRLDGQAIPLDPGAHRFRFVTDGFDPKELDYSARVGDRNRLVEVVFGEPAPAASAPAPVAAPVPMAPPPSAKPEGGVPAATYVLAGVSAAALGTFAYLRLTAVSDYNDLRNTCSPACKPDDVDAVRTKSTLSFVALGVSAIALTAATVVYFSTSGSEERPGTEIGFGVAPSFAGAQLRTRF